MKSKFKILLILTIFVGMFYILSNTNMVKAATYGHYTYKENSDGTITITKYDGTAAENLVIPSMIDGKSVTVIGQGAFKDCSGLTGNLTIGNSVTSIGEYAFWRCNGLTGNLVIPNSVTSIGRCAFSGCSGFTGNLVIPDSVTSIDHQAFYGCTGFTGDLVIPDSVTSIGGVAFKNCSGFTGNLTIGNSVTSIGAGAFTGCSGFTGDLIIPDSVTSIESYAFENCSGFTGDLIIGNGVTSIGEFTFHDCKGLIGNLTIGNSVTSIGAGAFTGCSGLTGKLVIPDSVTSIGNQAFFECSGFTGDLVIPNSVTSIKYAAFYGCSGFTGDLVIPDSVTSIEGSAFENCRGFTGSLIIGNGVTTSICDGIFDGCSGFKGSLIIGNSVPSIEHNAFYRCRGFTGDLVIGNSVTSIGFCAFEGCSGFTGNLVIPNSVTSIGNCAFEDCSGFTGNLTIGNSVTSIGNAAFAKCSGFTGDLIIPDSVTSIGDNAFAGCRGFIGSLTIPNSVTSIGRWAFSGCSGFTGKLVISDSVTSIGESTFSDCSGFTGNLTIPDSVTSIEKYAFSECRGFTGKLVIPDSVTSLGNCAFWRCNGLTGNLVIPNSVTSIGNCAFEDCSGFTGDLIIPDSVTSIGDGAFRECSGFTGNLTIGNSVTSIGNATFSGCRGFTGKLVIPDSVTSIGNQAFWRCNGLTGNLVIPNSVTSIGDWAFRDCSGFTGNLTIPYSVTSIGIGAFCSCENIDKIIFVADAPTIESRTFEDYNNKIYYRKGTTGYTAANNWPTDRLVEYNETLKKTNYTINKLVLGASSPKIELDSTLSPLVTSTFDVANNNIITVSKSGNVGYITPVNNGTTEVTVNLKYSDSVVRTLKANVTVDIKVTNVNLDKTSYTFNSGKYGQTLQLNATVLPEKANNKVLNWTSSNTNVATVDSTGKVTTVGGGECVITATTTDGTNISATCNIKVPKIVKEIKLEKEKYVITDETPVTINAEVLPSDADNKNLKWTSSNTDVVVVNAQSNTLQAKATKVGNSGKSIITVESTDGSGVKVTCEVEVNIPPTEISIDKTSYTLSGNEDSVTLNASVIPSTAYQDVIWSSSDENVAVVDSEGKVIPVSNGECRIIASAKENSDIKAECNITVEKIPIKITKLTFDYPGSYILFSKITYTYTLKTKIEPQNATNKELVWTSSDESIAKVDSTGKITPVSNGRCYVTATTKDGSNLSATKEVCVEVPIPITKITLSKTSYTFTDSTPLQINATISPENATNKKLTWTSSDTNIAIVDSEGKVTPVSNGTCVITATAKDGSGEKATCNITVSIPEIIKATKITLDVENYTITSIGQTPAFIPKIEPSNVTNKEVKWTSSNESIATVSSTGVIKGVGNGECVITATTLDGSNLSASIKITVNIPIKVTKITLSKTSYTFTNSTPLQINATIEPENAANKELTWASSDTNVATVSSTGKVTPVSNGTCVITATAKDGSKIKATCSIIVNLNGSGETYKKGDINKDGKVTVMDVRYGLKALTKGTITAEEIKIGDVNGDGKFSVMDARKILRYIVGKIPSLD